MTFNEYKAIQNIRTIEYKNLLVEINKYFSLFGSDEYNKDLFFDFWEFNSFIEQFELKVIKSQGTQKENGLKHLETLYRMQEFNARVFAKFNYENVLFRAKSKRLQKEQFVFIEKIDELEKEIKLLNNLKEF
jgi:hypothetical protein